THRDTSASLADGVLLPPAPAPCGFRRWRPIGIPGACRVAERETRVIRWLIPSGHRRQRVADLRGVNHCRRYPGATGRSSRDGMWWRGYANRGFARCGRSTMLQVAFAADTPM